MEILNIKYGTVYPNVSPPEPIRLTNVAWAGSPERKMEDGSEVQPWHCLPFVEGSTYGLELVYPFETECQVVAENGTIRFDWDFAKEPGGIFFGGEFKSFSPKAASQYYSFATWLYLVPPPGYVLRSEPHPRYFTDNTGTVPLPMIGHLQNEWWPRRLFLAFRSPPQGRRHIFRKGEPFAQILFVPQRVKYEITKLSEEENARRLDLERDIIDSHLDIADNIWRNPEGVAFSNHYKVLARAFGRDGMEGVNEVVQKGVERSANSLPKGKTLPECIEVGKQRIREGKYEQAETIFRYVLERDSNNAAAYNSLGVCFVAFGNFSGGLEALARAAALEPASPNYHFNLGVQQQFQGFYKEAEATFLKALRLAPHDPQILVYLGITLAQQGQNAEAREHFEAALAIAPDFAPARQALKKLAENLANEAST